MNDLFLFEAMRSYIDLYLGRPGLIKGGQGRVVEISKVGFQSVDRADGSTQDVICAFYRPVPHGKARAEELEIFTDRHKHDGRSVRVVYRPSGLLHEPASGAVSKKTVPDTRYSFHFSTEVN